MPDAPSGDAIPQPSGRAAAREVAEDLETIFADTLRPSRAPARARRRPFRLCGLSGGKASNGRVRAATLGGLAAAALVGVSAGALMTRAAGVDLHWRDAGPGLAQLYPARATAPIAAAPTSPAPSPAPAPAPTQLAAVAPSVAAPAAAPLDISPAVAHGDAPASRELAVHHRSTCTARLGRCEPASLRAADRRLRRAYAAASRAGVGHPVLASYHRRWTDLARRAKADPHQVAAAYDHMARELDRITARRPALHEVSHRSRRRRPLLLRILWPWR